MKMKIEHCRIDFQQISSQKFLELSIRYNNKGPIGIEKSVNKNALNKLALKITVGLRQNFIT
jgi:hypothetical protein